MAKKDVSEFKEPKESKEFSILSPEFGEYIHNSYQALNPAYKEAERLLKEFFTGFPKETDKFPGRIIVIDSVEKTDINQLHIANDVLNQAVKTVLANRKLPENAFTFRIGKAKSSTYEEVNSVMLLFTEGKYKVADFTKELQNEVVNTLRTQERFLNPPERTELEELDISNRQRLFTAPSTHTNKWSQSRH